MAHSLFAEVVLPLPLPKLFSYSVPEEMVAQMQFGARVEVPFGKRKRYSGLVVNLHDQPPEGYRVKEILSVLDTQPVIYPTQYQFWEWMAHYYFSTVGQVMQAALPSYLKLSGETNITLSSLYEDFSGQLTDNELVLAEALRHQDVLSIEAAQKVVGEKHVMPIVQRMIDKKAVFIEEKLKQKYKPKKVLCVRLSEAYTSDPSALAKAFDLTEKAAKQTEALLGLIQLSKSQEHIRKQDIYKKGKVGASAVDGLVKKGIVEVYDKNVSRLATYSGDIREAHDLTELQKTALSSIRQQFNTTNTVLLHGVTGSGKTRVYMELIWETISRGGQVLYLLPEIALTSQIINRLKQVFGDDVLVYHSRMNNNERVEVWHAVFEGKPIILGARSGVFLPFTNLQLVIVDEEHDASFKQQDPAPRYHGRNAALYLAHLFRAKTILGTATPALETYRNVSNEKYGLATMSERITQVELPELILVDLKREIKERKIQSHFSSVLIEAIQKALAKEEQVILFQNRRGYSPVLTCHTCGWHSECKNCDVALTYHKYADNLRCHYCGYQEKLRPACPACGTQPLSLTGFGTQKIEEEIKIYFPEAKIGRMDYDTTGGKQGFERIIQQFDEKDIDILVGTQMVTKGLDFDNVSLVGILSADQLFAFPDFRAGERAFQMMTQVSGRAGRKKKRGKVIIQAFQVGHPIIKDLMDGRYERFAKRELGERQNFQYPPFYQMIKIVIKHRYAGTAEGAAKLMGHYLSNAVSGKVLGPAWAPVARVRNQYQMLIQLKIQYRKGLFAQTRHHIDQAIISLKSQKGFSSVRVNVDVDPM